MKCAVPRAPLALLAAALLSLPPTAAHAVELLDGKLSLSGFGGAATGRSWDNPYLNGSPEGNRSDAYFTLSLLAKPQERLTLAAQVETHLRNGLTETSLDWAFGEYRVADALRLRLGQAKLPTGLYGELRDAGTLRPFYSLPQGLYGQSELSTENYTGVGLTGQLLEASDWALEYDVVAGLVRVRSENPIDALLGLPSHTTPYLVWGGRLALLPPVDGLRVMGTASRAVPRPGLLREGGDAVDSTAAVLTGLSAELVRERWLLRAEGFISFFEQGLGRAEIGYVEAAYFLTRQLQAAARLDVSRFPYPEALEVLGRHRDVALGLNYWFTPEFVLKASYHHVQGNRFAYPETLQALFPVGQLSERTQLVQLGTHFSF